MSTAHNVNQMVAEDGKFRFRFHDRLGGPARAVWGYRIPGIYPVIKLDGEHTYLWHNDPRIEQIVLEFAEGGTYAERVAAHQTEQFTLRGCQMSSDGEVCLYPQCPLTEGKPGMIPDGKGSCPHDRLSGQEKLDFADPPAS